MRSQFPRHVKGNDVMDIWSKVSISDEKPVPSPPDAPEYCWLHLSQFQSQMRSQFPRHLLQSSSPRRDVHVSISDEKPVPSPRPGCTRSGWQVEVSISDEKPVPSPRSLLMAPL